MEYTRLTDEQKNQVRENALTNIEAEHYSNVLAHKRAMASDNTERAEVYAAEIAALEKQHKALSE